MKGGWKKWGRGDSMDLQSQRGLDPRRAQDGWRVDLAVNPGWVVGCGMRGEGSWGTRNKHRMMTIGMERLALLHTLPFWNS